MEAINYGDVFYQVNRTDRTNLENHSFIILEALSKWRESGHEFVYISERSDKSVAGTSSHRSTNKMMGNSSVYQMGRGFVCRAEDKAAVVKELHHPTHGFYVKKEDASEEIKVLMRGELENLKQKKEGIQNTINRIKEELGDE